MTSVSFPYSYENGEDLSGCCHRLFNCYLEMLSQVDRDSIDSLTGDTRDLLAANDALPQRDLDVIRDARELGEATLKCMEQYFAGFPLRAFDEFKTFFEDFSFYHFNSLPRLIFHPKKSFYRVRKGSGFSGQYGELFHIPFEKRAKASSERFSVSGCPALYLSGSLATACMETGIEKGETFAYSRFEAVKDIELLDLSFFNKSAEKDAWEYFSFLVNYPLIMACHIPVKDPADASKPEYFIPQLVMQLVLMTDINGIAYLSAKQIDSAEKAFEKTNVILSVDNVDGKSGYCESLINSFRMTSPVEIPTSLSPDARKFYAECDGFDALPLVIAPGTCQKIDLPYEINGSGPGSAPSAAISTLAPSRRRSAPCAGWMTST